jgi:hypothetical protein
VKTWNRERGQGNLSPRRMEEGFQQKKALDTNEEEFCQTQKEEN